jgi:hypothetical protein
MSETDSKVQIEKIRLRLAALKQEQAALEAELGALQRAQSKPKASGVAANQSSIGALNASEKVALFRCLFSGRTDVFPLRWENKRTQRAGYAPACTNEWVKGVCGKPQVKCGECPNQAFIPVTDQVIEHHLRGDDGMGRRNGDYVAGVYPLFPDETCWFLAADFDGESWVEDALAYVETCRAKDVPAALERSRSGNGGHVWIFFSAPVPARLARQLGALLITETMERRPEIGFASYDRFFPSQDTMPIGGFGNLIALPLQRGARAQGNSVFVDSDLRPHEDQWNFLSSLGRLSPEAVKALVADAEAGGRVLGVRLPVEDENTDEPWRMPPSRRRDPPPVTEPVPKTIELVLADQIYIDRTKLPPSLVTRLIRLAAFQNPEFYRAQAMRLSTFGKPRIISCAELHPRHVALPRGCLDETAEMLNALGVTAAILDHRETGKPLPVQFAGYLRSEQAQALDALAKQDCGVLAATTAFGKTVVAAALIAQRACNTLILVHRRELLAQWVERLRTFLSVGKDDIGIIGGGCRKQTGRIDVALIQSLVRKGEVSDLIAGYGHLIVNATICRQPALSLWRAAPRHGL